MTIVLKKYEGDLSEFGVADLSGEHLIKRFVENLKEEKKLLRFDQHWNLYIITRN